MKKIKVVIWYFWFYVCCAWLLTFVFMGGIHDYEYMLNEASSEITSWCQLPMEKDPVRKEMYMLFIIQFSIVGLVFLRKKNHVFIASMSLVFCYATYALILKDMICANF